ncbi:MAG: pyrroloquinoline quinone precursor peptide PqqA [Zoogloea sp.]|nr:pyrroloquinoline quinone precursor peptide PqqA [Zoogloea sp.]
MGEAANQDFREAGVCRPLPHCAPRYCHRRAGSNNPIIWRLIMTWTTPQACDLRFGFEITMYIAAK